MPSSHRTLLLGPAKLELEKGCQNTSVIGGFDKFALKNLIDIKHTEPATTKNVDRFVAFFEHYLQLPVEKRLKLLEILLDFLGLEKNEYKSPTLEKPVIPTGFYIPPSDRQKLQLSTPIQMIPGVGPTRGKRFEEFGLKTVFDLLKHFPSRYIDRSRIVKISSIKTGQDVTFKGEVLDVRPPRPGKRFIQALFGDQTGRVMATWFNAPFVLKKLEVGKTYFVSGRAGDFGGPHMTNPDLDETTQTQRVIPVYPATAKIPQWLLHQTMKFSVDRIPDMDPGWMPAELIKKMDLPGLTVSYATIHRPTNLESVEIAKKRVIFESLLLLETGLLLERARFKKQTAQIIKDSKALTKSFFDSLPFEPTNAQQIVREEIAKDLESGVPMNRLLHGDVGSGKTVVGFASVHAVISEGFQAAWIAPTEVLASQTFKNAKKMLSGNIMYLSGVTKKSQRAEILKVLQTGEPALVIGTHAVLEDWIEFPKLALCVVDEQHRFGVMQRARLAKKGMSPHILVMSATPIPRTLAMTLYGDLDVSAIDEMPAGRIPIKTKVFTDSGAQAYKKALEEIASEHRVYVVCPLVEESEKLDAKSAVQHFEELKATHFKGIECGLLHGRMKSAEKEEVMRAFAGGVIKVLISTTVIEVGIDVPEATVMIVENAERFGLAQLHQLRGRVGRGKDQSYCFLISEKQAQALQILERTTNGLEVAEEDLKIRGPGDIGGTMQSGIPNLEVAALLTPANLPMLSLARREAEAILEADPDLTSGQNARLREGIEKHMSQKTGFAWVS